jgi:Ribonuclease G/E
VRGRQILVEPLPTGGDAAALVVDGRLQDLLIDADASDPAPRPEAVYRAVPGRPMKGLGGTIVDLGAGRTGFLRGPTLPAPGRPLLVQVAGWAEPGKAPPVSARLRLKGRTAMLTPGAPGINVSRGLRDPDRRAALAEVAAAAMAGADPDLGLVLRTAAGEAADAEIGAEIAALRADWTAVVATDGRPGLARTAPGAAAAALRDWRQPGDAVREAATALADAGVWEQVEALAGPLVPLGQGSMAVEVTLALVAVDVNTGGDLSPAAALKINLAAAAELPRQLRLRGLGGQVTVDFAPLARADRPRVERALLAALKADGIETTLAGWTPLGHLELNRKRARRPLALSGRRS